jgi:hypothetical protein
MRLLKKSASAPNTTVAPPRTARIERIHGGYFTGCNRGERRRLIRANVVDGRMEAGVGHQSSGVHGIDG